jgi:predicted DsbA family dithiol-disulfide isomerase
VEGKGAAVEWEPFELRPEPHPTLRPEGDYLRRGWQQSVYPLAARMGVEIHLPPVSPQPHTRLAWEGFQFAKERGRGSEYNHRVLEAFFVEGRDIGDPGVLAELAGEVGLGAPDFRAALGGRRYREAHSLALRRAHELGITSVPAFEIGDRLLVGVQPAEALEAAIARAGAAPGAGSACGPDGCSAG